MELILTGRTMPAAEAKAAGLVTKVVPAAQTVEAALELADAHRRRCRRWRSVPPNVPCWPPRSCRLTAGLRAERAAFFDLFATEDQREGMRAFMEKRQPTWTGR